MANKKKNSASKKLFSAVAMLTCSAVMLSTATYAWFTMNKTVTLTGMEVKTHVGSNLLIQKSTMAQTGKEAEATFITDETQTLSAVIEPVSTVDGESFFYTLDAKADGSKLTDVATKPYIEYDPSTAATNTTDYGNKFSEDYGATKTFVNSFAAAPYADSAVGYVDYVFQLKATNTDTGAEAAKAINLTKLELTYNGTDANTADGNKAFRAAVFVEDFDSSSAFTAGVGTLDGIYKATGGTNWDGKAVSDVDELTAITYTTDGVLATVPADSIKYYKVVVRLYLEGEDQSCNTSTFKTLTDDWSLDLEMKLGEGTPVTTMSVVD